MPRPRGLGHAPTTGAHRYNALLFGAALGVLGVLSGAPTARADANAEARVFFEQGNQRFAAAMEARGTRRRNLLEGALEAYVASLRIVRSRNVLFNAGVTADELGRLDESFGYFRDYVSMSDLSDAERQEGEGRLATLRPRVAVLAVVTDPPGAEVRVDRRDLGARGDTPAEFAAPVGEHVLFLTREGYADAEVAATATTGERTEVHATLTMLPVAVHIVRPDAAHVWVDSQPLAENADGDVELLPGRHQIRVADSAGAEAEQSIEVPVASGRITVEPVLRVPFGVLAVQSNVPILVEVDSRPLGSGRSLRTPLQAGQHVVRVSANGFATARTRVAVDARQTVELHATMTPVTAGASMMGRWPYYVGGAGIATAIVASGLSVRALRADQEFEDSAGVQLVDEQERLADRVDDANRVADVVWLVTAALGTAAAVLWALDEDEAPPPSRVTIQGASPQASAAADRWVW